MNVIKNESRIKNESENENENENENEKEEKIILKFRKYSIDGFVSIFVSIFISIVCVEKNEINLQTEYELGSDNIRIALRMKNEK